MPPSARSAAPFVAEDSGLAMYATSEAISDGSVNRLMIDSGLVFSK
jgi:hypothetical protein